MSEASSENWEPPAGTTKRKCPSCLQWFASRGNRICLICKNSKKGGDSSLGDPGHAGKQTIKARHR